MPRLVGLEERLESEGVPKPNECADADALGEEKGPSVASEGLLVSAVVAAGADAEGNGAGMVNRASSSSSFRSSEVVTGFRAEMGVVLPSAGDTSSKGEMPFCVVLYLSLSLSLVLYASLWSRTLVLHLFCGPYRHTKVRYLVM
jgi:hypothetical protein